MGNEKYETKNKMKYKIFYTDPETNKPTFIIFKESDYLRFKSDINALRYNDTIFLQGVGDIMVKAYNGSKAIEEKKGMLMPKDYYIKSRYELADFSKEENKKEWGLIFSGTLIYYPEILILGLQTINKIALSVFNLPDNSKIRKEIHEVGDENFNAVNWINYYKKNSK